MTAAHRDPSLLRPGIRSRTLTYPVRPPWDELDEIEFLLAQRTRPRRAGPIESCPYGRVPHDERLHR